MDEQSVQAFVTIEDTFLVACPHCKAEKLLRVADFPPDTNPISYACPCGTPLKVTLNYRKAPRKAVKLVGIFTIPSEPKKIERMCEILDISSTGMRLSIDSVKNLTVGQQLLTRIVLDDPRRSKLELPCTIRNIGKEGIRFVVGVQFDELDEPRRQALGFYTMTLKG